MKVPTLLTAHVFALLFAGLNATTTAVGAPRQVIITYPKETSSEMLAEARFQLEKAVCSLPSPPSDTFFLSVPATE